MRRILGFHREPPNVLQSGGQFASTEPLPAARKNAKYPASAYSAQGLHRHYAKLAAMRHSRGSFDSRCRAQRVVPV